MSYDNPRLGGNLVVYRERLGIDGEGFKNDRQFPATLRHSAGWNVCLKAAIRGL